MCLQLIRAAEPLFMHVRTCRWADRHLLLRRQPGHVFIMQISCALTSDLSESNRLLIQSNKAKSWSDLVTHTHTHTLLQQVISTWLACFYATWWNIEEIEREEHSACMYVCLLNFTVSFITDVMKSEAKCLTQLRPATGTHTQWKQHFTHSHTHLFTLFLHVLSSFSWIPPVFHLCCCDTKVLISTWVCNLSLWVCVCVKSPNFLCINLQSGPSSVLVVPLSLSLSLCVSPQGILIRRASGKRSV